MQYSHLQRVHSQPL